jgi:hypothetical protein
MDPIGGIVAIASFRSKVIDDWFTSKQKEVELIYNSIVKDSYQDLEAIHKDYTTNLTKLRFYLDEKSLPPRELVRWLMEVGVRLRSERQALPAIEASISKFRWELDPNDEDKERSFYWCLVEYVDAILWYYKGMSYPQNLSYYSYYQELLAGLIDDVEVHREINAELFYESEEAQQVNQDLALVLHDILPDRWLNVTVKYRQVQAAAGFPA